MLPRDAMTGRRTGGDGPGPVTVPSRATIEALRSATHCVGLPAARATAYAAPLMETEDDAQPVSQAAFVSRIWRGAAASCAAP